MHIYFYIYVCIYFLFQESGTVKSSFSAPKQILMFSNASPVEVTTASQTSHHTCLFSSFYMSLAKGHCVTKQIMAKKLSNKTKTKTGSLSIPILVLISSSELRSSLNAEGFGSACYQPWEPNHSVSQQTKSF